MRLSKLSTLSTFVLLILLDVCLGGNYLFYFPFAAKSHMMALMPLVNELATRGHQVTMIVPYASLDLRSGVTEIIIASNSSSSFLKQMTAEQMDTSSQLTLAAKVRMVHSVIEEAYHVNEAAMTHPEVQQLLLNNNTFDVAVVSPIYCNEVGYFLAHKHNSSLVLWSSNPSSLPWMNWAGGSPYNPSYMPLSVLPFTPQMTFVKRVINTLASMAFTFYIREWQILPKVDELLSRVFPDEDLPDIAAMERKASLSITVGNPFIADGLRPVLPNTILAGFMSCVPGNPLPRRLQEWIDGAEHGVVYVSFGSVLKPQVMPEQKRKMFVEVLGSLKQRVIFKWEGELEDQPSNLLTSPWLPQKDILAHPNVRLFVTHGGAGSIQETICYKTPVVGIPIMADQTANLNEAVNKGFGVIIEWKDVTKDRLLSAVRQVLEEDRFLSSVSRLSDLVMDQPHHPLHSAAWWMEYVLRHPGNVDMVSPVHGLSWWQYFLIDVILAIAAALLALGWIVVKLSKAGWRTARWLSRSGWRTARWMSKAGWRTARWMSRSGWRLAKAESRMGMEGWRMVRWMAVAGWRMEGWRMKGWRMEGWRIVRWMAVAGWKRVRETPVLFFVVTIGTSLGFSYFTV